MKQTCSRCSFTHDYYLLCRPIIAHSIDVFGTMSTNVSRVNNFCVTREFAVSTGYCNFLCTLGDNKAILQRCRTHMCCGDKIGTKRRQIWIRQHEDWIFLLLSTFRSLFSAFLLSELFTPTWYHDYCAACVRVCEHTQICEIKTFLLDISLYCCLQLCGIFIALFFFCLFQEIFHDADVDILMALLITSSYMRVQDIEIQFSSTLVLIAFSTHT